MDKKRDLGSRDVRIPREGGWSLRRAKAAKEEWKAKLRTLPNIVKVRLEIKPIGDKFGEYFIRDTSVYDRNYHW